MLSGDNSGCKRAKSKKNDYCNSKLHSLEEAVKNSDATNFWKCLKSMDDAVKVEDTPLVSRKLAAAF